MLSRIVKTTWHKVYNSLEVAKRRVPLDSASAIVVNNKVICLVHRAEGFYAIDDKCPHQGTSLAGGELTSRGEIVCPWHKYSFDLKSGRDTCGIGEYVNTYEVRAEENGLFIGLEKKIWKWF